MANCRDKNPVRIFRIHEDRGDLLGIAQAEMLPGFAAVAGFVDSIANREIRAPQSFAAAYVNDFGIGRRDGKSADGAGGLIIKNRTPRLSVSRLSSTRHRCWAPCRRHSACRECR